MKTLTIGSVSFEATSCERMRHLTKGFYLSISVPVGNIGMDELHALLDGNREAIVVTEEDGTESTYNGFNAIGDFSCAKGAILVSQFCESEVQAQLSIAQNKVVAQEKSISTMQNTISAQSEEILAQAKVIVAQGETIAMQNEQVAALMEASTSQLDAIDSIMTEVLPLVAQEAATMAVDMALAAIKETETPEELPEETPETSEEENEITLEEAEAEAVLTEEN